MAKSKSGKYTNLLIYAAIIALEAFLLYIFKVGQPIVGYTAMLITVCIGAIYLGTLGGTIVGIAAGLAGFILGIGISAPSIYIVLMTCVPKAVMGLCVALIYRKLKSSLSSILAEILCVIAGLVINACCVSLVFMLGSVLNESLGSMDLLQTIKDIFLSFANLGRALIGVLVP